jgi:hypothetical protein
MIKLLLTLILEYIDGGYKRRKASSGQFTIVIYEVINKSNIAFTRIDIFTKASTSNEKKTEVN